MAYAIRASMMVNVLVVIALLAVSGVAFLFACKKTWKLISQIARTHISTSHAFASSGPRGQWDSSDNNVTWNGAGNVLQSGETARNFPGEALLSISI